MASKKTSFSLTVTVPADKVEESEKAAERRFLPPTPVDLALERFEKRHPPHADKLRKDGAPHYVHVLPSPTTDHIRVQCGCGHMERYTFRELGLASTERRVRTAPG